MWSECVLVELSRIARAMAWRMTRRLRGYLGWCVWCIRIRLRGAS